MFQKEIADWLTNSYDYTDDADYQAALLSLIIDKRIKEQIDRAVERELEYNILPLTQIAAERMANVIRTELGVNHVDVYGNEVHP